MNRFGVHDMTPCRFLKLMLFVYMFAHLMTISCSRFGCGAVLVCGRFGFSVWPFWSDLWPIWFVTVLDIIPFCMCLHFLCTVGICIKYLECIMTD